MNDAKKKYAFISYSHKDERIARWLQRKLESYKLPSEIHNEFDDSRYLRPIFRDKTDLTVGILSNEIKNNLYNSKYLIVICSPNSAQSEWVNKEVKTFIEWGRIENIILFVVDGEIGGELDYRPTSLRKHIEDHPENELLALDIRQYGKRQAYIQVVSRMLGLEFDVLWKRHIRQQKKRAACYSILTTIIVSLFYWFAVPVKVQVTLQTPYKLVEDNPEGRLQIGNQIHLLTNYDTTVVEFIPGYLRLQEIPLHFEAPYYNHLTTSLKIKTFSVLDNYCFFIERDNTFRFFAGTIVNADFSPIHGIVVEVEDYNCVTDSEGRFCIKIPDDQQTPYKSIVIKRNGKVLFQREDESPSENLVYILKE